MGFLKKLFLVLAATCTATACLLSSMATAVHAATLPTGFSESIVISGLTEPAAVSFSPDGRVFVAEKSGLIKVFDNLSATTPTIFHDLRTNVHNFWDRGLLGMELHPDFPAIPYVYVLYTYDKDPSDPRVPRWGTPGGSSDPCPNPPGPTTDGCVVSGRLSRLEASLGSSVSTGTEAVLVEGWGQQYASHSIGTVMFGPDGALYAGAGEGASFTFADYGQAGNPLNPLGDPPAGVGGVQTPPTAEGGATRAQSLRRLAGPAILNGAIIRVDPATGAGLSDNPLFSSADLNARRIVGYGLRNPFRFTIRPGTSEVWIGDVGWNGWEEINRIPDVLSPTVKNFGWPCYEGTAPQPSYQALGLYICQNLYAQAGGHTPPYFTYGHSQQVVAGETCPIGSSAIAGLAFYTGGTYPPTYESALFFSDYSRGCIWVMFKGANGLPDPATRQTFVAGAAGPVQLQIGPGGDLFYVDLGGTIRRVKFASGNQAPDAVIQATPLSGPLPLDVTFDGSASSDPDAGDTLTYSWDLNGDGIFDDALTAQTSYRYSQTKLYNVQLRVTDNHGAPHTTSVLISAGNSPPTAYIDSPVTGTQWQVGQSIVFSGHATDPELGTLPSSALSWEIILHHCPSNCHTHPLQTFSGVTSSSFPAPDHEYSSYLEIKLTVTDAWGLTDTKSLLLYPNTVALDFQTNPSGLQLVVGSSSSFTPFTRTVILGSTNSVSAVTPQTLGGTTYNFVSWSDGGNQSHLIIGTGPATYVATYTVGGDTTPPTPPTGLTASPLSGTQITLSWTASTDNVGVTGYQVERCQGAGCTAFVLIATPTTTSYGDPGLTPGTSYSYRVRATDAVGNLSGYSNVATATTLSSGGPTRRELANDNFDRANNTDLGSAWEAGYTSEPNAQIVGNAVRGTVLGGNSVESYNAVSLPNDQWAQVTIKTISGTAEKRIAVLLRTSAPATWNGYACVAGKNTGDLITTIIQRIDAGTRTNIVSESATTWAATDTLRCEVVGSNITASRNGASVLTVNDTTYTSGRAGIRTYAQSTDALSDVEIDSFIAGDVVGQDTTPPTPPTGLTASPLSGTQITLSWTASTDNVGVTGYQVERCQGAGCTAFVLIATPTTTSYGDPGLTPGTSYSYRVRATDAVGNLSGYSSVATATTTTPADTTPPTATVTAPTEGATVAGTVTVTATATDNVGVVGVQFLLDGATLGTEDTSAPYSLAWNTTTAANGPHQLAARARDAAGNQTTSLLVNVTVANADTTPPTPPTGLTASPLSGTQITLSWTASTDNVGVTGYQVERCQGAGCTAFVLIATPTTTSYGDPGLTPRTRYRYRVRATDAAGNLSGYSNIVNVRTDR